MVAGCAQRTPRKPSHEMEGPGATGDDQLSPKGRKSLLRIQYVFHTEILTLLLAPFSRHFDPMQYLRVD